MNGNDDFFGGSLTPPSPLGGGQQTGAVNPHMAANKEYGSFASPTSSPAPGTRSAYQPIVIAVAALVILALSAFFGYRAVFGPKIVMPEELLGLQRQNLETDLNDQVDELSSDGFGQDGAKAHMGIYGSGTEALIVVAAEEGTTDAAKMDQFFTSISGAVSSGTSSTTLQAATPGPHGGTMKCFQDATSGVGGCAWVSEDTTGVVMASAGRDFADTTRQVRDEIER